MLSARALLGLSGWLDMVEDDINIPAQIPDLEGIPRGFNPLAKSIVFYPEEQNKTVEDLLSDKNAGNKVVRLMANYLFKGVTLKSTPEMNTAKQNIPKLTTFHKFPNAEVEGYQFSHNEYKAYLKMFLSKLKGGIAISETRDSNAIATYDSENRNIVLTGDSFPPKSKIDPEFIVGKTLAQIIDSGNHAELIGSWKEGESFKRHGIAGPTEGRVFESFDIPIEEQFPRRLLDAIDKGRPLYYDFLDKHIRIERDGSKIKVVIDLEKYFTEVFSREGIARRPTGGDISSKEHALESNLFDIMSDVSPPDISFNEMPIAWNKKQNNIEGFLMSAYGVPADNKSEVHNFIGDGLKSAISDKSIIDTLTTNVKNNGSFSQFFEARDGRITMGELVLEMNIETNTFTDATFSLFEKVVTQKIEAEEQIKALTPAVEGDNVALLEYAISDKKAGDAKTPEEAEEKMSLKEIEELRLQYGKTLDAAEKSVKSAEAALKNMDNLTYHDDNIALVSLKEIKYAPSNGKISTAQIHPQMYRRFSEQNIPTQEKNKTRIHSEGKHGRRGYSSRDKEAGRLEFLNSLTSAYQRLDNMIDGIEEYGG